MRSQEEAYMICDYLDPDQNSKVRRLNQEMDKQDLPSNLFDGKKLRE